MALPARQALTIGHVSDVAVARRLARELSLSVGLDAQTTEEIVLAVSELGANLVKHAQGGELILTCLEENHCRGLQIESRDHGPGMADVEQALADRYTTAGSLGYGLGVVNRLMDQLEIASVPGQGTYLCCRRWQRPPDGDAELCPLAFGVATRPHPQMKVNGDAFTIKRWQQFALVAVIDGLGHGPFAHRAARTARHYVEKHYDQPLADIFRGVGRACRATRGVVMALARWDWRLGRLSFASVGNVAARVFGNAEPLNFLVRRGVLGGNAPSPVVTEHPWHPSWILVLHSDGVSSHWRWEDFPGLSQQTAPALAQQLLAALAKDNDDATVLVVRDAKS